MDWEDPVDCIWIINESVLNKTQQQKNVHLLKWNSLHLQNVSLKGSMVNGINSESRGGIIAGSRLV